uniref:Uncharacterized protein n=1 Tax=Octopus bimaculoides TaxID=37653 RepID=A0A0L8H808_OCTBM
MSRVHCYMSKVYCIYQAYTVCITKVYCISVYLCQEVPASMHIHITEEIINEHVKNKKNYYKK